MRNSVWVGAVALAIVLCFSISNTVSLLAAQEFETQLSKEEVDAVKKILNRDKMLHGLSKEQAGLSALHRLISLSTPGPVKLVLQWNQSLLKGWRNANAALTSLGKAVTCDEITLLEIEYSKNERFWSQLATARGCLD